MRKLALLVLSVLTLAACGGEDASETGAADTGASDSGQVIEISARDFEFDPPELSADPGEVTFRLTNDGTAPHALEIEGNGVEESSNVINGGDETELTVSLDEGTYEIYCPVGDHADRGMVGTLTVGSGGGGAGTDTDETETEDGETETGETTTEDDSAGSGSGY